MSTEAVIEAKGLTKSYGSFRALRGIDLSVQRGEVFGFLGPNGAGKTTAIRCMLDLIRPGSGTLQVLGMDPQAHSLQVRQRCGYLPGELRLDENLPARRALRFFLDLRGGRKDDWQRAEQMAERLELRIDERIKNLSKGNKQKVGIIAALMHRPELLLLDEPTSGLDPLVQQTVMELVREAREDGATVFFSSHVLTEVQGLAERVAIIREGEVAQVGTTDELLGGAMLNVRVEFADGETIDADHLAALEGVTFLEQDGIRFQLAVEGGMDALLKFCARHRVITLETRKRTLEEVFLEHYGEEDGA